jgi:hypothetical protein
MGQLLNRLKEIDEMSRRYKFKAYETFALNLAAILEENGLNYENLLKELINIHKSEEDKDFEHLF